MTYVVITQEKLCWWPKGTLDALEDGQEEGDQEQSNLKISFDFVNVNFKKKDLIRLR